ncbi:MAG: serine/threonine-protein kinase, partial [Planctomycetota bacterium]
MNETQPTSSPTDATLPGTPAGTDPSAKTITLPKSVADQVTVAAGIHGATQDGLHRPTFRARYEIGQELGHGGMGVVYAASDRDLGRTVAMKVMAPEVTGSKEHAARFLREIQTTAQLEHPNIMPVYDVGISDEGCLFYTMKLVRGKTLSASLRGLRERHDEHSIPRLLDVFLQICNGVTYAHAKGVLHRDLKPDNVMLGEHGEVVVMDWGLAKLLGSVERPLEQGSVRTQSGSTLAGTVIGTPAYMAPEQARAETESIGAHTDVYALGAILYEMLTLRAPYVGTDSHDILSKVLRGGPLSPPRSLNPAVGKPLNAIVARAMAADAGSRYAEADQLAEDVRRFLDGKPVTAYTEGIADKLARGMRRYRRRILLAMSVAVVCLLGVAGLRFVGRRQGEARALASLEKAKTSIRGIRDTTATFDLRMGSYSDARRDCDKALSQAPHLDAAQRMRSEVILEFANVAAERREFDLAQMLKLELEAYEGRWGDLDARAAALGSMLSAEEARVRAALDAVFSMVRNREIELIFSDEGEDSLPESVEEQVGTLRGRWSIEACLARLQAKEEEDSVRAVAALLLARYGAREEGVLNLLRGGLAPGTTATVLVAYAEALGALGDAGAVPLLLARLADAIPGDQEEEDPFLPSIGPGGMGGAAGVPVTHRLGAAIARYGPSVAPEVRKALLGASASPNARTVGYLLLTRCGGAPAVRAIVGSAKDPSVGGLVLARELV